MIPSWHATLGLVGAGLIALCYLLLHAGRMDPTRLPYSVWNGVGAAAILISLSQEFNLAAFVIEAFWLLVSLYGVTRALRRSPSS